MRNRLWTAAASVAIVAAWAGGAAADELLSSYLARISERDHFASDGYPLSTAAQMVRQDRANWHQFGSEDDEDQADDYLQSAEARARFERLLNRDGAISIPVQNAIVGGQPVVEVSIYRNSVYVELIEE